MDKVARYKEKYTSQDSAEGCSLSQTESSTEIQKKLSLSLILLLVKLLYSKNLGGSVLSTCECCMILDSVADWI